jgi:hypothetical protein
LSHLKGKRTFQSIVASLTKLPQYENMTDESLRGQMLSIIFSKCVSFSNNFEITDNLFAQPVTLQAGSGTQYIESKTVQYVDDVQAWSSEVKVVKQ